LPANLVRPIKRALIPFPFWRTKHGEDTRFSLPIKSTQNGASERRKNLAGAPNHYDIGLFDEFHEPDPQSSIIGATQEGTSFANTI